MTADLARQFASTNGKVLLLTNPESAGYVQNPISVYYCYSSDGTLHRAIAEVTNTPWGERVTFVFDPHGDITPKCLHVSPFMDMDNTWHLKATEPGASLVLSVVITHPTLGQYFDAHLIAHKCEHGTHDRNEHAGLMTLLR
eukprot:jgi/Chrzof1/10683/Cz05g08150.t1